MAELKHIEWLYEGDAPWNERRSKEIFRPDFTDFSFRNQNRTDINLIYADFSGCLIEDCQFNGGSLRRTKFFKVNIRSTKFLNTNWRESSIKSSSRFTGCTFINVNFWGASFSDVAFSGCQFKKCNFRNARFFRTQATNCMFEDNNFENVDLNGISGLSQDDIETSIGNPRTVQPDYLDRPSIWRPEIAAERVERDTERKNLLSGIVPKIPADVLPTHFDGESISTLPRNTRIDDKDIRSALEAFSNIAQDLINRGGLSNSFPAADTVIRRLHILSSSDLDEFDVVGFGSYQLHLKNLTERAKQGVEYENISTEAQAAIDSLIAISEIILPNIKRWRDIIEKNLDDEIQNISENAVASKLNEISETLKSIKTADPHFSNFISQIKDLVLDSVLSKARPFKLAVRAVGDFMRGIFRFFSQMAQETLEEFRKQAPAKAASAIVTALLAGGVLGFVSLFEKSLGWIKAARDALTSLGIL